MTHTLYAIDGRHVPSAEVLYCAPIIFRLVSALPRLGFQGRVLLFSTFSSSRGCSPVSPPAVLHLGDGIGRHVIFSRLNSEG